MSPGKPQPEFVVLTTGVLVGVEADVEQCGHAHHDRRMAKTISVAKLAQQAGMSSGSPELVEMPASFVDDLGKRADQGVSGMRV